jgi:hypothetical protein
LNQQKQSNNNLCKSVFHLWLLTAFPFLSKLGGNFPNFVAITTFAAPHRKLTPPASLANFVLN